QGNSSQAFSSVTSVVLSNLTTVTDNIGGGSWSSGVYTVPYSGYYLVGGGASITSVTQASGTASSLFIYPSSTSTKLLASSFAPAANANIALAGQRLIKLVAGETVSLALAFGSSTSGTIAGSGSSLVNLSLNRVADQYGNPVVGFGHATESNFGLVKKN